MLSNYRIVLSLLATYLLSAGITCGDERLNRDYSPPESERQLPLEMHSAMDELPIVRVGVDEGDLVGRDNRVLQAAVEYIAALGGGTVEIGAGEYLMRDSLHLRSGVHIVGQGEATVLRKADGLALPLAIDGDFGEQQITTVDHPSGFGVGQGLTVWVDGGGGFHTTVARITGKKGNTYSFDKPLMTDCVISLNAKAGTLFPVVSGYEISGASIKGVTIEGNKEHNAHLNGCRGGGIFLYRGFGTVIEDCVVRNYNGDGISFQQSNDVRVVNCISEGNTELGLHPGSGSQRPTVQGCIARNNGTDGLFLCWRVRHGLFEDNLLENNGRFGISIGHKDTDNLLKKNIVRLNHLNGIFFRDESLGMAGHRNRLVENVIEDNGREPGTAAIRVRGETNDLVFEGNIVRDTRQDQAQKTQTVGVQLEESVGNVSLQDNQIEATNMVDDQRQVANTEENAGIER